MLLSTFMEEILARIVVEVLQNSRNGVRICGVRGERTEGSSWGET